MRKNIIDIIGVQMDLGASRKGVDMGPLAIRHTGLIDKLKEKGYRVCDHGDIAVDIFGDEAEGWNEKLKYQKEINMANVKLYEVVRSALINDRFPLILGGDHSIAAGSVEASVETYDNIGVIWMDAHGDFNDEAISPTGNMHGMPLSAVCGLGPDSMVAFSRKRVDPKKVVIVGARDLDPLEKIKLKDVGVNVYSIGDVHRMGIGHIMKNALEIVSEGTEGFHFSFDMDCLEPNEAPGVGTPVQNGLTIREAYMACELVAESQNLLSMDFVEVNPLLDIRNKTGVLASNLILTCFG